MTNTVFTKASRAAMLVTKADNIRGRLAIKSVIGSEDGLLEWSEKLRASMVKLQISHELLVRWNPHRFFGGKPTCPRWVSDAVEKTPAASLVIAVGDVTGAHPDHLITEVCADAFDYGCESPPT
jgi:hypothetical protein